MNHDPARGPEHGVVDTRAAGRNDRASPPGFGDSGGWHTDVAGAVHAGGTPGCSRVAPCVVAGGTRQRQRLRGNLKTALLWCLPEGAAMQEPLRFRRRGSILIPASNQNTPSPMLMMIGLMIAPSAGMMLFVPADVQKTTFSDDR